MNLKYSKDHEWIKILDNNEILLGITDHAQDALGELVYIELPELNSEFTKSDSIIVVESAKSASDVYIPADGEIIEINESLVDNPSIVNESPYENGWMVKIKISDPSQLEELLTEEDYNKIIEED